jgi:PhnB protein
MLSDEQPDINVLSPKTIGGSPVLVNLYVEDADAVFKTAVDNGATVLQEVEDQFYGDRSGQFIDPFGHRWSVATHVEDVPPDEMEKRMKEFMG